MSGLREKGRRGGSSGREEKAELTCRSGVGGKGASGELFQILRDYPEMLVSFCGSGREGRELEVSR